jgi:hypothetical protein
VKQRSPSSSRATDDEGNGDPPSSMAIGDTAPESKTRSRASSAMPDVSKGGARLGRIGGKAKASKPAEQAAMQTPKYEDEESTTDEDLANAGKRAKDAPTEKRPSASAKQPPSPAVRSSPPAEKPAKKKLGVIGGTKRNAITKPNAPRKESEGSDDVSQQFLEAGAASRERSAGPSRRSHILPVQTERNVTSKVKTPEPETTAEERADEERLRLKRELEEKARVPTKKKRRF